MRLTDAHKSVAYAFSSGLVHLMLLAIEFTDHQKSTIPAWLKEGKGYGFRQCSDALQVPSEVLQLLAQTSLQGAFLPIPFHAQTKEISSRFLPIGPGFRYSRRSMSVELVDEYFTLLPGIIEQTEIGRICYIYRCAGGINNEFALLGGAGSGFIIVVVVCPHCLLFRLLHLQEFILQSCQISMFETLAKMGHARRVEGCFILIAVQSDDILEIRIFLDLLNGFNIGQAEFFFDDEGSQCHTNG